MTDHPTAIDPLKPWLNVKPRADPEGQLQRAIVQHLKLLALDDCIWFSVPNGEHRSKRTAGRLKALGVVKGIPDFAFTLRDGSSAYMELKAPKGRLSPEQRAFEAKCSDMGVEHAVVYSIDTALAILRAWGVLPEESD